MTEQVKQVKRPVGCPKGARNSLIDALIGANLRNKRIAAGQSRAQLGALLNVSGQQLHKYETGNNRVSASILYRLAHIFQCPLDAFFVAIDTPKTQPLKSRACLEYARLFENLPAAKKQAILKLLRII